MTIVSAASKDVVLGVTASATGKILLTGGYLVLEQPNQGLVLSLDARIHSSVYALNPASNYISSLEVPAGAFKIYLITPQITRDVIELYAQVHYDEKQSDVQVLLGGMVSRNKFISTTLQHCLTMAASMLKRDYFTRLTSNGLFIYVYGDTPFYTSNPLHINWDVKCDEEQLHGIPIETIHTFSPDDFKTKTGLGSSAALVSSLTTATFAYFGLFASGSETLKALDANAILPSLGQYDHEIAFRVAYQTAQFAHCAAQGKVGSGFDVAASFYGNQTYCRFSPECIHSLLSYTLQTPPSGSVLLKVLGPAHCQSPTNSSQPLWDDISDVFGLPRGLQLILGDVHGGSETPGMVKSILKWRDTDPSGPTVWSSVADANIEVAKAFRLLSELSHSFPEIYDNVHSKLRVLPSKSWNLSADMNSEEQSIVDAFVQLRNTMEKARVAIRYLGDCANVPIEPSAQTTIIDRALDITGVVAAGVPGAGGYDALYVLYLEDTDAVSQLTTQWKEISQTSQSTLKTEQKPEQKEESDHNKQINQISVLPVSVVRVPKPLLIAPSARIVPSSLVQE